MEIAFKKVTGLAEVKAVFESIEEKGDEWFSNLLASDDEVVRWIGKGQVSIAVKPTTAVLLRQRYGCQRLFFANTNREMLSEDLQACLITASGKIITSILDRNGESSSIKVFLRTAGFSHYAVLNRIVKINEPKPSKFKAVQYAQTEDLQQIIKILQTYFDPLLDQNPDIDDIEEAIKQKRIIVGRNHPQGEVVAFLSFHRKGKTLEGGFLVSMEEYRDQKPWGAILSLNYLKLNSDMRKMTGWVLPDNHVSIKMHKQMGYDFDGISEEFFLWNGTL